MKKQISFYFFSLFLFSMLLGIGSCKKSPKTIKVSGYAVDATTGAVIPDAHVAIARYTATGTGYGKEVLDERETNSCGWYHFEISNSSGSEHHILGTLKGYFDTDIYENSVPEKSDIDDFNIEFTPKGYVNFVLNMADTSYDGITANCQGIQTNDQLNAVKGIYSRDSIIILYKGNQVNDITVHISKSKNGAVIDSHVDHHSVYCIAGDTVTYVATY